MDGSLGLEGFKEIFSKALLDTVLIEYVFYPVVIGLVLWGILCICYWNLEKHDDV